MNKHFKKLISMLALLAVSAGTQAQSTNVTDVNTSTTLSESQPQEPILLRHADLMELYGTSRDDKFALAADYNAAPINPILSEYMDNSQSVDGQIYYLEGGKTYYIDGDSRYPVTKGFTLATNPADVAKGLRAKVICGIGKGADFFNGTIDEQWQSSYAMFYLGRQPEETDAEDAMISIKKLAFHDIDFDNPKALNYGDNQAGAGFGTGNYFFNMFSNGLPLTLDNLVIENCTFKRLVRGFIREQGPNYKIWNHVLIKNNQFFDCGYYSKGAGGYAWIAGSGSNAASNLYKDFKVIENTFYDSPFPSFFNETKNDIAWTAGPWNITFSNNTLVNFNTRANGAIFKMRYLPDGSVYNVENNLFVLTKQPDDQRVLQMWGADIRNTASLPNGNAGKVTLNFNNNWSTNDNLTNGSIFSGNAWTSTNNSFRKLVNNGVAVLNGTLEVNVADVSSTELFVSPCPPHKAITDSDQNMHRADALDGTAKEYNVNLFFKNTNNDIYKNNVGAARWRVNVNDPTGVNVVENNAKAVGNNIIYNLNGQRVKKPSKGIYIKNGKAILFK